MSYVGDDDWDYQNRRRSPRGPRGYYNEYRRSGEFLNPGRSNGLHRTRSTGNQPAPNIYIYNDQVQDAQQRAESGYMPPPPAPAPYPASPEFRGRDRGSSRGHLGDDLVDELAEMQLRDRIRSRSRGRSDVGRMGTPDFYQWQLEQKERELEAERQKQLWEKEAELQRLKDAAKRDKAAADAENNRKRTIAEYEEKKRKDAAAAQEAEIRAIEKMEREKQEEKAERRRIAQELEQEKREAKAERERIAREVEQEKRDAEAKEKREYEEFLEKQRKKKEKEEKEKKEEKARFEREMRKRLEEFGYTQTQIDYMVDEEKAKKYKEELSRSRSRGRTTVTTAVETWRGGSARPVYPKVHRDYLSVDTLLYYDIPYEFDRADPNYIIIRREMDKYETEILFEHTKRLRTGNANKLLEAPKNEKNYAWYRKRDRSTSRVRKVGILEVKKII